MTGIQYAELVSAAFGATGTIVLFLNSYADEPLQGGVFGSDEIYELNRRIKAKNLRRHTWQKVGLVFLCISFVVQAVAVFL